MPDIFEQIMLPLDQAKLAAEFERLGRQTRRPPGEAFADLGATLIRSTNRVIGALNPLYSSLVGLAAADLIAARSRPRRRTTRPSSRLLDDAESHIEEFQLAQRKVIREFRSRVDVLEGRLSSSRLGGAP